MGRRFLDVVSFGENPIIDRLMGEEAQLVARGLTIHVAGKAVLVNPTISSLAAHPGWRVVTLSDARQGERMSDEERAERCAGRPCWPTRSRTRSRPSVAPPSSWPASSTMTTGR